MKVARLHAAGDIRVQDEPEPEAQRGDVLVRITAVGLCGSDLHWYAEGGIGDTVVERPLVLGHEQAGVIADGPRGGERVAVDPAIPCMRCEFCFEGNHNLCSALRFSGSESDDGALRELMAWPGAHLYPLPDTISDAGGAMLEPLGVALHALDLSHLRLASTVAVVGCGPIGLFIVQLARAGGATRVIAVEPLAHRREAAVRMGAHEAISPQEALADGASGMADLTFEVAGNDDGLAECMHLARPGSKVLLVGIPEGDATALPASVARRKGLSFVVVRRMKEMYPRAIKLVQRGLADVESMVTATYALDDVVDAFDTAVARSGLKVLVTPTQPVR